mmetsp:Transcript_30563/g.46135  ORF Transcript_30563/g.46135 Transcript_30563/m.46135 type:complete len:81 (-) Transcript_30563:281-523(-)
MSPPLFKRASELGNPVNRKEPSEWAEGKRLSLAARLARGEVDGGLPGRVVVFMMMFFVVIVIVIKKLWQECIEAGRCICS